MQLRQFNEEVLYSDDLIVEVDNSDITVFKEKLASNQRKRIRLCTHRNVDDSLHEMLIIHTKGTYIRPHKHLNRTESFHVIEGLTDVIIFDDTGKVTDVIPMGDYSSGRKFYYRMNASRYHSLLIHSDYLVFHETTNGPFNRMETILASWAPDESDTSAVERFISQLAKDF